MCLVSMSERAKVRLQRSHIWGNRLPPLLLLPKSAGTALALCLEAMCLARRSGMEKIWPQTGQTKMASPPAGGGVELPATSGPSSECSRTPLAVRTLRPPRFVDLERPRPRLFGFLFEDIVTSAAGMDTSTVRPRTDRSRGDSWVEEASDSKEPRLPGLINWNGVVVVVAVDVVDVDGEAAWRRGFPLPCRKMSHSLKFRSGLAMRLYSSFRYAVE